MSSSSPLSKPRKLKACSLYRAINWIAFGEQPIEEDIARLIYPERNNFIQLSKDSVTSEVYAEAMIWYDRVHKDKFAQSGKELLAQLILGNIKASGFQLLDWQEDNKRKRIASSYKDGYELRWDDDRTAIPKEFWREHMLELDHVVSEASVAPHYITKDQGFGGFAEIEVDCKELVRVFPFAEDSKRVETRGRKQKYDWEAFNHQIILIANSIDGLPETQAELIEEMALWCDQNWDDTPGESTLKDKISPIYQRLVQAKK